jgi:hypothetical protein
VILRKKKLVAQQGGKGRQKAFNLYLKRESGQLKPSGVKNRNKATTVKPEEIRTAHATCVGV